MAVASVLQTYADTASPKEDVVKRAVEILTATENQIANVIGDSVAINTVHHFLRDTLATAASLAVAEGADYTATGAQVPSRGTNVVSIIAKNFKVTRTSQQVERYTGENELNRQTRKGLLDWGNAYEFDLVRSTLVSGLSGTVPKMSELYKMFVIEYNRVYEYLRQMFNTYSKQKSQTLLDLSSCYKTNTKVCI